MHPDVLVVGAGPVGCFLAENVAKCGFEVAIVEEHPQVGHPSCCAGVVGIGGMRRLGFRKGNWVIEEIRCARFFSPDGSSVKVGRGRKEAWVIDRPAFDRMLAERAVRAGANLHLCTRCTRIRPETPKVRLSGRLSGFVRPQLVVGADGPLSAVGRASGLRLREFTPCAQMTLSGEIEKGTVEVYLGRRFSPGFFAWGVPAGETCRVGLGLTSGSPLRNLEALLSEHPAISGRFDPSSVLAVGVRVIPRSFLERPATGRILLVGDAAGQVKPLTGGGIVMGLLCARMAASSIAAALEEGRPELASQLYVKMFRSEMLRELWVSRAASRILFSLPDGELGRLISLLREERVVRTIARSFDFDRHSRLVKDLLPLLPEILPRIGSMALRLLRPGTRGET